MKIPHNGRVLLKEEYSDSDNIKVLLTGDLCPTADVERKFLQGQGEEVFGNVLPELLDKDISITNLELVLTNGGESIDKCGPNIKADPAVMSELVKADFDVYSVANNHARDLSDEAFMETLSHIENAGANHVGGGSNISTAAKPLKLEVKGIKLAIFSISMHCDCDAGADTPGVNVLNLPYNTIDIMKASQDGYKVIVVFHDGKEFVPFPAERIRNYCRAFVDAGASAVIGHHPHIIRGVEIYKDALIAYSLGNFLFPQRDGAAMPDPFWFDGFSVRLLINQSGLSGFDIIPHNYNPKTVNLELMQGDKLNAFLDNLNVLNKILATENENERYFSADCENFGHYADYFSKFSKNLSNNSWDSHEAKQSAKAFHHFLTCDEHWDLLKALSKRKWDGNTDSPEDLKDIISNLGRPYQPEP